MLQNIYVVKLSFHQLSTCLITTNFQHESMKHFKNQQSTRSKFSRKHCFTIFLIYRTHRAFLENKNVSVILKIKTSLWINNKFFLLESKPFSGVPVICLAFAEQFHMSCWKTCSHSSMPALMPRAMVDVAAGWLRQRLRCLRERPGNWEHVDGRSPRGEETSTSSSSLKTFHPLELYQGKPIYPEFSLGQVLSDKFIWKRSLTITPNDHKSLT